MAQFKEKTTTTEELTALSDILYPFLDNALKNSDHWFALKLWQCWPELATTDLLKQSRPVQFQNGRLLLWVSHSVQLMELSFQIKELKDKINSYFEKPWVQDIHWTLNTDTLKSREKSAQILSKIFQNTKK